MLKIGICDDDFAFGCQIEGFLNHYAQKENIEIEVMVFLSGEEYIDYLNEDTALDILFLDIELGKKMDGVTVGQMIRSDLSNEVTQIVYVSAKESYAMKLFQNRPMDFLIKPVKDRDVEKIMDEYKRIFSGKKLFFEFRVGKSTCRIAVDEIMYFQCVGKKVQIVMSSGEEKEFYGSMKEVEKQISQEKFWVLHKSYIVNINFVAEFCADEVVLVSGDILPISRAKQKKIQEKLLNLKIAGRDWNDNL